MFASTSPRFADPSQDARVGRAIQTYAEQNRVSIGSVPADVVAKELLAEQSSSASRPLQLRIWTQEVVRVREALVPKAARATEEGERFSQSTRPTSLHGAKPLPVTSPLMLGKNLEVPAKQPLAKASSSKARFQEALEAMRSRGGESVQAGSLAALGLRNADVLHPSTRSGGRVFDSVPGVEAVGQGRVEVHPFRWKELGIDPTGKKEDGTTLVIRSRHWRDKIAGEGATFKLSLVGGNTLPIEIASVKPKYSAAMVVLNISDAEISEMIGTKVGHNLRFQVDAAFTDEERPAGRHTQRAEFSVPTREVADVERRRIGWAEHQTVDINIARTDGVVAALRSKIPGLQSLTTMMETEAEYVLPPGHDMLGARRQLFDLAMDPKRAEEILGDRYQLYPADKYIQKDLRGISQEAYEELPMKERSAYWVRGSDGLPATIGHTDTVLDTEDKALMKAGLILRVRANERGTVLSLKSVSQQGASKDSRVRFCADASLPKGTTAEEAISTLRKLLATRSEDALDPNPFIDGVESAGVKIGVEGLAVAPVLQVDSRRDRVRILDTRDSSNVELSLDRSTITPYGSEGQLEPERAVTSLGFEYGLEHAGVSPSDAHAPEKEEAPKEAVQGFRGFHLPSDLDHPSLHDSRSARNRAFGEVVSRLTGAVFGARVELAPGGFKAIEGAEALGLIDGSWREVAAEREKRG